MEYLRNTLEGHPSQVHKTIVPELCSSFKIFDWYLLKRFVLNEAESEYDINSKPSKLLVHDSRRHWGHQVKSTLDSSTT